MANHYKSSQKLRLEIAQVAAKFVAVDGINDYLTAKRKAALHIGANPDRNLPTNSEVEQALINYQKLFQGSNQKKLLHSLRTKALKAMRFLKQYNPKLVGPVLSGTATEYSEITLHIFCDEPEQIGFYLDERGIPFTSCEKTIRANSSEKIGMPAYKFEADDDTIVLIVFSENYRNLVPLSSVTNRPMQRASLRKVESLLEEAV